MCSGDVAGLAAQNRALLAERGEKLSRLDERTAQMEADAQDFATMARRLAEQEKNKKWWQL